MQIFIETQRLIIRELRPTDEAGMFALDADPAVHTYLGNNPIKTREQAQQSIAMIQQQYVENKIGRWAVLEKETRDFMGWVGLKLIKDTVNKHTNYYDLGYRLIRKYWHKGYATEAAQASLDYGFKVLKQPEIFAIADTQNLASKKVLEKVGFTCRETFAYAGVPHYWFKISLPDWERNNYN